MEVGILTYHRSCNYGAYLQACALCGRLNEEEGITAEIIDFRMSKEAKRYSMSSTRWPLKRIIRHPFKYFHQKNLYYTFAQAADEPIMNKSERRMVSDSIEDFCEFAASQYDVIVVGSDEVWKTDGFRGFPTPYWLIGDFKCRKFAYAVSARSDFSKLGDVHLKQLKNAINEFEFVGVRDMMTYNSVKECINDVSKLHLCCDPSFLYDFKIKKRNINDIPCLKSKVDKYKETIVVMTENVKIAKNIRKRLGNNYNLISVFEWQYGYKNIKNLKPMEWMELIANADLVITSFFHGVCFSMVNNTPFIALGTKSKSSKLEELLDTDELRKRYIQNAENEIANVAMDRLINSAMADADFSDIVKERRKSFNIFIEALKA